MIEAFHKYNLENQLIDSGDKILLTVSGGIDSMTMFHLFSTLNYSFGIAHCNFNLRGEESDRDEQFVKSSIEGMSLQLFTKSFDTKKFAQENKLSIQMAARKLRYEWFEEIALKYGFTKIATAHNLNDLAETFLINLTRSTGIKGLTGIKPRAGKIIRPLLFATRKQIEQYTKENCIDFREDSSNAETKYLRNAIRHKLIPELIKMNPSFLQGIVHTTDLLNDAESIYRKHIKQLKNASLTVKGDVHVIKRAPLRDQNITPALLYEILNEYGFSYDAAKKISCAAEGQSGIMFFSQSHTLLLNRDEILITELNKNETRDKYIIDSLTDTEHLPINLAITKHRIDNTFAIPKLNNHAIFDAQLIKFPLILRKWRNGDFFYPFGMKGRKKLSDYFTDHKFSLLDKKNTWLLTTDDDILWIINHRTDNRYKITGKSKSALHIVFME